MSIRSSTWQTRGDDSQSWKKNFPKDICGPVGYWQKFKRQLDQVTCGQKYGRKLVKPLRIEKNKNGKTRWVKYCPQKPGETRIAAIMFSCSFECCVRKTINIGSTAFCDWDVFFLHDRFVPETVLDLQYSDLPENNWFTSMIGQGIVLMLPPQQTWPATCFYAFFHIKALWWVACGSKHVHSDFASSSFDVNWQKRFVQSRKFSNLSFEDQGQDGITEVKICEKNQEHKQNICFWDVIVFGFWGGAAGFALQSLLAEWRVSIEVRVATDCIDFTAARGISLRRGLNKGRHIATRELWPQERVSRKELNVERVSTAENRGSAFDERKTYRIDNEGWA